MKSKPKVKKEEKTEPKSAEKSEEPLAEKEEMLPTLKGSMNSYNANC